MLERHRTDRALLVAASACFLMVACDDAAGPENPVSSVPPDVRAWVTGEAAAQLDPDGHFILPAPAPSNTGPIISEERAECLAMAFIRTFLWSDDAVPGFEPLIQELEREHGRQIDWRRVKPRRERMYYAASAHEELPADVPLYLRRAFGPAYLIPLEFEGFEVTLLTVAAHSTDTSIDDDDTIVFPTSSGGEFTWSGIPWSVRNWVPISPEEAVEIVATTTDARVIRVPRLTRIAYSHPPLAKWEVVLEQPVTLRVSETGELRTTDTVYLGPAPEWKIEWFLPRTEQPVERTLRYNVDGVEYSVHAFFREDVPVIFDHVTPVVE